MTWGTSAWGDKPLGWVPPASGVTYTLIGDSAAMTLTGQDATLTAQRRLVADSEALILARQDVGLIVGRRLAADSSAMTLTGQAATLTYSGTPPDAPIVPSNMVWVSPDRSMTLISPSRSMTMVSPDRALVLSSPSRGNT